MILTKITRQWAIRWALCAILVNALMPTITHALRSEGADAWAEICTVLGAKWVATGQTGSDAPMPAKVLPPDDCPYCALQASMPFLPPALTAPLAATPLQFALPRLFLVATRTPHTWVTAQPRAPPRNA